MNDTDNQASGECIIAPSVIRMCFVLLQRRPAEKQGLTFEELLLAANKHFRTRWFVPRNAWVLPLVACEL